jgi:hypothetical protein
VVVLGRHEDESVVLRDRGGPGLGVLVLVVALRGHVHLVEERQVEVGQVDEVVLRVIPLARDVEQPASGRLALPPRTGAAEDDADLDR